MIRYGVTDFTFTGPAAEANGPSGFAVYDKDGIVAVAASYSDAIFLMRAFEEDDEEHLRFHARELAETLGVDLEQDPEHASRDFAREFLRTWHESDNHPWGDLAPNVTDPDSGLPNWLHVEIQEALGGDSNDAEHDALVSVADHFGVHYTSYEDRMADEEYDNEEEG